MFGDCMKKDNYKSYLIIGMILVFIGFIILFGSVNLFKSIANVLLILMILISIKDLFSFLSKNRSKGIKLIIRIINVLLCIIAYIFNEYSIAIVPIIFSIYSLINSFANLFNFFLLKYNKLRGEFRLLFLGLIYLTLGIIILFEPLIHLDIVLKILGIYSLSLGITFIFDYLEMNNYNKFIKIRISLPSIIEAFIPLSVLQGFNKMINNKEEVKYIHKKNDENPDLEIFIHVTENGYGRLGHLDICYNNEIISFGNYDISSYKLHEIIGNGILFTTKNKKKYIEFCIKDNNKTLFVFGLKLKEEEKVKIESNINKIKGQLKPWNPPYKEAKLKNKVMKKNEYRDYASRLYKYTKANFYKFKMGKYKVFFVLGNNCVSLANKIISSALKDSFKFYGIITPGTYYDYLEREFMKKDSIVVSKKIYTKNNIK